MVNSRGPWVRRIALTAAICGVAYACGTKPTLPSQPTTALALSPPVVATAADVTHAGGSARLAAAAVVGAPTNLAAAISRNTVTLTWTAPPGEAVAAYSIEAGTAPGTSDLVGGMSTASAATTYTTQVSSGTYYAR